MTTDHDVPVTWEPSYSEQIDLKKMFGVSGDLKNGYKRFEWKQTLEMTKLLRANNLV